MCTAAVEGATEAPVGPFSATIPHNAKYYAFCGVTYLFALRWQQKDRALKREIDAYKAEHAPPAPAVRASCVRSRCAFARLLCFSPHVC